MTRGGLEARVGLTIVLAAIILIVGTMWFQKFQLVEDRYTFYCEFDQVGGLVAGDPIMVNGVESGRVDGVDLGPNRVVAAMAIREGVEIPDDSHIQLKSIGIMGERFVAVTKGESSRALAPGDTTSGAFLMGLSEVMGQAGAILDEIAETSRNLREILDTLNDEGKLENTLANLAEVSARLREFSEEAQPDLQKAIDRFGNVATMMDSLIAGHYAALDSSFAAVGRSGARFESAVADLDSVSSDLKEITSKIQRGEGTLGRLVYDEEMVQRLESAISGLDSLILDIKHHPGRYVTFELF